MALASQPAWSILGDDVPIQLAIHADASDAVEIHVVVHEAISSRIGFERTINGDRLGSTVTSLVRPVADLPVVGPNRVLTLALQDPAAARDSSRIRLNVSGAAGVFPVEIELRATATGDVLSSFVTHLVAIRRAAAVAPASPTRLQVAWLWRVAAPPSTTTAGDASPAFAAALTPTGRLGRLGQALGETGGVPVTLVPNPETVAGARALGDDPAATDFVDDPPDAAATSSILAGPYTTLDGPALLRAGLATHSRRSWVSDARPSSRISMPRSTTRSRHRNPSMPPCSTGCAPTPGRPASSWTRARSPRPSRPTSSRRRARSGSTPAPARSTRSR